MTDFSNIHASIAAVNAMADQLQTRAEKEFYRERKVPKMHKNTLDFEPVMLKSALFRPGTGQRATYREYVEVPSHGANRIQFAGEELRQDDLRVLLMLLKARAGSGIHGVNTFGARAFVRDTLGWADSGDSVAKLKACIIRLKRADVRVDYADGALGLYSFISDAETDGETWHVWLSVKLATMFERHPTYLPQEERLALRDGLTSWLLGFIKADACFVPFSRAMLRELSGSLGYEQKAFNVVLKASLEQLQAAGLIKGFEVRVFKEFENKGKLLKISK